MVCHFGGSLIEISGTQAKTVSTQAKKSKTKIVSLFAKSFQFQYLVIPIKFSMYCFKYRHFYSVIIINKPFVVK